jgi:uncharacterized protein (DUF302 family)
MASSGLISSKSRCSVKESVDRLVAALPELHLQVFARIDHALGAEAVAMALRPTELLLFGAARGGTPLMQLNQTCGIDLPLKILAWQDAQGEVWLTYNDPQWLANRHQLGGAAGASVRALSEMLNKLVQRVGLG